MQQQKIIFIFRFPKGRWFLTIIARNQMLLAVILESRHLNNTTSSTSNLDSIETEIITPSPFYIEEIQDTLDHLRTGGIENLANTWINCNKRPQVNTIFLFFWKFKNIFSYRRKFLHIFR